MIGLSEMFILIGIAALLSVIFNPHTFPSTFSGWIGVAGSVMGALIGLFFVFLFFLALLWFARSIVDGYQGALGTLTATGDGGIMKMPWRYSGRGTQRVKYQKNSMNRWLTI